MTCWRCWATA
jgi:putative transposase